MAAVNFGDTIRTRQGAALIDGEHTEIVCSSFQDRLMIVVTQYGKLGTLVNVEQEAALRTENLSVPDGDHSKATFSTKVLLGKDEPIWHVYSRQIASRIAQTDKSNRPLLLAIALKTHSPEILNCILDLVETNRVW